jgi:hypothetical protein
MHMHPVAWLRNSGFGHFEFHGFTINVTPLVGLNFGAKASGWAGG